MPISPPVDDSPWAKPPERPVAAPPGSVTVSETAVHYAVAWGLQSSDPTTITQVTRMLSECHARLTRPAHLRVQSLISDVLLHVDKDDPVYRPFERVLGQMVTLDMKRGR